MSEPHASLSNRPVLVTGATGFLGRAAVRELLDRGVEVVALIRDRIADIARKEFRYSPRFHAIRGRMEDSFRLYSALAIHDIGAVFHFTPATAPGTANLFESVQRFDPRIPVIVARPTTAPLESHPNNVLGIARFGELYGGGDRNVARIVPATVLALLSGERAPAIAESPRRDFVYVGEAAKHCIALAESLLASDTPRCEDRTYRSGHELNDAEMAAAIRDVYECREPPQGRVLREGLTATIDWYREFLRNRFFGTKPVGTSLRVAA